MESTSHWISFLHHLGRFMATCQKRDGFRPGVILTLPCLEFASPLIASGIVAEKFKDPILPSGNLTNWKGRKGEDVSFAYKRINSRELRRLKGSIKGSDEFMGRERLLVRFLETENATGSRAVDPRWLELIKPLSESPPLDNLQGGSLLAADIEALESVIGQSGVSSLLGSSHQTCSLIDTKKRVREQTKCEFPLDRLGYPKAGEKLVLRDLVRLASEGPEAMAETNCCEVHSRPEPDWPTTVMAGSLRFIRSWDDCDSEVRVALLSPVENAYREAVELANDIYAQRADFDLTPPDQLLSLKPAVVDLQMMYSD